MSTHHDEDEPSDVFFDLPELEQLSDRYRVATKRLLMRAKRTPGGDVVISMSDLRHAFGRSPVVDRHGPRGLLRLRGISRRRDPIRD